VHANGCRNQSASTPPSRSTPSDFARSSNHCFSPQPSPSQSSARLLRIMTGPVVMADDNRYAVNHGSIELPEMSFVTVGCAGIR
jgi:hypothetical protein